VCRVSCMPCVRACVRACACMCTHLLQATTVVYANEEGVVHDAQLVEQGDVLVDLVDEHLALFRTQGDGLAQPVKVLVLHHHVGIVLDLIRKSGREEREETAVVSSAPRSHSSADPLGGGAPFPEASRGPPSSP